jgi:hypothetical protein
MKLPKAEQAERHWQTAAEMVLMAAEDRGPMMHAHFGMLQALSREASADAAITAQGGEGLQDRHDHLRILTES